MNALQQIKIMALKAAVGTIGQTSRGLRIAATSGFTSGVMLDYVYRNEAHGTLLIGPLLDRFYLSQTGWQVIRKRKENLERLTHIAIDMQRTSQRKPVIVDIASGPAQYLFDVLAHEAPDVDVICRDISAEAVAAGTDKIAAGQTQNIRFERGNALDPADLARLQPQPNIVIASGFYDWIDDDDVIRTNMRNVHRLLPAGGCFVFTNQSGHVDLETVNAVFKGYDGKQSLHMVTRPWRTVNAWAAAAGFTIQTTLTDEHGHYSVALARKEPPADGAESGERAVPQSRSGA